MENPKTNDPKAEMLRAEINKNHMSYYEHNPYYLISNWQLLKSEIQLKILSKAYREQNFMFLNNSIVYTSDVDKEIRNELDQDMRLFMKSDDLDEKTFLSGLKPQTVLSTIFKRFKMPDKIDNRTRYYGNIKWLAIYTNIKTYLDFFKQYGIAPESLAHSVIDTMNVDGVTNHINPFLYDATTVISRVKFLLDINPEDRKFVNEATLNRGLFHKKYKKQIEEKLSKMDQGTHEAISKLVNVSKDAEEEEIYLGYDKFIELALKSIYGDEVLNKRIDKIKSELGLNNSELIGNETDKESFVDDDRTGLDYLDVQEEKAINPKKIKIIHGLPKDESDSKEKGTHRKYRERVNNNVFNAIKVNEYLNYLEKEGMPCNTILESESGVKLFGEKYVRYYIFETGEYKILEPIGQAGNATLIIKASNEELKELLENNTKKEIMEKGIAVKYNHDRDEDSEEGEPKEYKYEPMRIINLATLISEVVARENIKKKQKKGWTIDEIVEQVTELVPKEDVPNVTRYISELSRRTGISRRIIEEVKKIENRDAGNDSNNQAKSDIGDR